MGIGFDRGTFDRVRSEEVRARAEVWCAEKAKRTLTTQVSPGASDPLVTQLLFTW